MTRKSKRIREIDTLVDKMKLYSIDEAIELLQKCPGVKFDQSVEVSVKTGVDPRKSDQLVRGTVSLPNGTGKRLVLVVFTKGDKIQEAKDAGAEYAGGDDLIEKVRAGWMEFDAVIATPDMMREVGKLGKVLGPRGLMPTPKAGTVTNDVAQAIKDVKGGKVEFKVDKGGVVNNLVGKLSFNRDALIQNINTFLSVLAKSRPSTVKGQFLQSLVVSSTMGPGIKIDLKSLSDLGG